MKLSVRRKPQGADCADWVVVNADTGEIVGSASTNAGAWKICEKFTFTDNAITPALVKRDAEIADEQQIWWSALLGLAYRKGRKKGWAAHTFKRKFGAWPSDELSDDFGDTFPALNMFLRDGGGKS